MWFSMIDLTICKPKPVPLPTGLVVKNGSNILFRLSWLIPEPSSSKRILTSLSINWEEIQMLPLVSMACDAFTNMLIKTCNNFCWQEWSNLWILIRKNKCVPPLIANAYRRNALFKEIH